MVNDREGGSSCYRRYLLTTFGELGNLGDNIIELGGRWALLKICMDGHFVSLK